MSLPSFGNAILDTISWSRMRLQYAKARTTRTVGLLGLQLTLNKSCLPRSLTADHLKSARTSRTGVVRILTLEL